MALPSSPSHFDRGVKLALGERVPQDLAAARAEFSAGTRLGEPGCMHALSSFLAGGIGGPRDWQGAVDLLGEWAMRDGLAAAQARLISAMKLTPEGYPQSTPPLEPLHPDVPIALVRGLLTPEECAMLIRLAEPRLMPAGVIVGTAAIEERPAIRDNEHAAFAMLQEPPFVRAVNTRIAAATDTDVRQGEPLQIMRYREGRQYRTHLDRIGSGTNQRLLTAIVYLNEGYGGGQTAFPALDIAVSGRTGDMLVFRNLTENGQVNLSMRHAGLPPVGGVKYIASRWILERPAYDRQGKLLGPTIWS